MKTYLRVLLWGVLLLILFVLILPIFGKPGFTLLFGWIGFLQRVVPSITVNWNGIGMVVLCSGLIIAATHWLCGWIYAHNTPQQDSRWRWRWSLSLYAGLWLLFIAAMGVTGFVHQVGWLMSSKEPLMRERNSYATSRMLMREVSMQILVAAENTDWNLASARQEFVSDSARLTSRRQPLEELHVLFIPGEQGRMTAAILFPRDRAQNERTGFILVGKEAARSVEEYPMKELQAVLARLGNK